MPEPSLERTRALARRLHAGQVDLGKRPYIQHLEAVEAGLGVRATELRRKLALLHDSVEDTGIGFDEIRAERYDEAFVSRLALLTMPKGKSPMGLTGEDLEIWRDRDYAAKIQVIVDSDDMNAMAVKRSDNDHNVRYDRSHEALTAALESLESGGPHP